MSSTCRHALRAACRPAENAPPPSPPHTDPPTATPQRPTQHTAAATCLRGRGVGVARRGAGWLAQRGVAGQRIHLNHAQAQLGLGGDGDVPALQATSGGGAGGWAAGFRSAPVKALLPEAQGSQQLRWWGWRGWAVATAGGIASRQVQRQLQLESLEHVGAQRALFATQAQQGLHDRRGSRRLQRLPGWAARRR